MEKTKINARIVADSINPQVNDKFIKSPIGVGDVIEIDEYGDKNYQIYKVEQLEVVLNSLYTPTNLVILVTLSYNNGISWTQRTWDNIKYVRHISHKQ